MIFRRILIAWIGLILAGCDIPQTSVTPDTAPAAGLRADSVYLNGRIYTANTEQPWVEAIAIQGGKFVALGTSSQMQLLVDADTTVNDLQGRLVLPGLYDSHLHPIDGMAQELFRCNFPFTGTLEDAVAAVAACAEKQPDSRWISGGQWNAGVFDTRIPTKEMLDAVVPDRPVYLVDATGHHAWVNSRALQIAGITKDTLEPQGGSIVRDEADGEAVGTLLETAKMLVANRVPGFTTEQYGQALRGIQERMNAFGFVGMKSAATSLAHLQALKSLDDDERLTIRVGAHLSFIDPTTDPDRATELENTIRDRNRYASPLIRTDFIKFVLDGVPPSHTAAYLEPYADRPEHYGEVLIPQATLNDLTVRFDKMGMTIKYHAAGDGAARVAVNAIEAARAANGNSGLMHEIGHASMMHPADISRLADLGGIAEVSPILWYPSPFIVRVHRRVMGEDRYRQSWPVRPYVDAGVTTVAGSDWPAAVASPNPWPAIEAMVTRRNPYGEMPGEVRGAANAVSLGTTISIYTRNGAIAMGIGDRAGSIEVGKLADIIVLNHNIFEIPPEDVSETQVDMTVLDGRVVYRR
jgi:predicted amidohydrolase YtcJ